ncbi:hypothetical protein BWL13_01994 [Microbacterium oleivorans]|uniref:HAD hydrolase family protein n=1 Tax=Microbacterium oleivorans TaxID=273677 RepID=UPI0009FB3559|nr:HAD hydrolase family protein [Microbacterium oleivorans]AZS44406.1 hypothetical protein BWL13_01994 [Microbacterium oleivorans]
MNNDLVKAKDYEAALARLGSTYQSALLDPIEDQLTSARVQLSGRALIAIGSGGATAAAVAAARFWRRRTGLPARVLSPLAFIEQAVRIDAEAVMIFSARAKHPDSGFAAQHALARSLPVVLVTERDRRDLAGPLADPRIAVVTIPKQPLDGFLATSSVLAMATIAARLVGVQLSPRLKIPTLPPVIGASRLLVLHTDVGQPAAVDIETRMNELGLADVQVADARTFAHGRHVGLHRRSSNTTVIALRDGESGQVLDRTIAALPSGATVLWVRADAGTDAERTLTLLAAVMQLPVHPAAAAGINPAKPSVPQFGRALYHLPYKRAFPVSDITPVDRKLAAAGFGAEECSARSLYEEAHAVWLDSLKRARIRGAVLDYDGTVVKTDERYSLPSAEVQSQLIRLIREGLQVCFATGRGDSLYRDLRSWLPAELWPRVHLSLHNGAWQQPLNAQLHEHTAAASDLLLELAEDLRPFQAAGLLTMRISPSQISIRAAGALTSPKDLAAIVTAASSTLPTLKVAASAHSVDVVEGTSGKAQTLRRFESQWGTCLAVGDRGDVGGNDFEMLHETPHTVTVDACSPSLTRCWNLQAGARGGPDALLAILRRLRSTRAGFKLSNITNG